MGETVLSPQSFLSCSAVFTMNKHTIHKQSFLQLAKTFIRFSGGSKTKDQDTNEERPRKHKTLRKTVSLGSTGIEVRKEEDVRHDPHYDTNKGKLEMFNSPQEGRISQSSFKPKYHSQKVRGGRDQKETTAENSFKPKFYSQKVKSIRDQTENSTVPKHRVKLKQLPEKPGRRKFSLKGVGYGGARLHRRNHNRSCPDLTNREEMVRDVIHYDINDTIIV